MSNIDKRALKPGTYAILFRNNWDGEGDVYETLATLSNDLVWYHYENGNVLIEYEGDEVLKAWPLDDGSNVLALLDELEAAEKRAAELEVVKELFLRAKALMYQSGGTPIENSLNPIDAWLYDAESAAMLKGAEPSKMSGIMPDYEGGTLTQRELFRAGWEAHHRAMLQSGAPVQFGWSKGHFGYNALFNAISKAVSIQGAALSISVSAFEDAMLAAAPQLEMT